MYRSKYNFTPGKTRHEDLPSIESTVQKHFEVPAHDFSLSIPYAIRNQHVYVPGKTRHGKSTLFHSMALQDIQNGAGVCVIDPKGDLVNSLIHHIPESRKDDCVYLSTTEPVPIDFMDPRGDKETLVGDIKYVITKGMSPEQAPLMDAILTDLCYTLLNANENPEMAANERATGGYRSGALPLLLRCALYRRLSHPHRRSRLHKENLHRQSARFGAGDSLRQYSGPQLRPRLPHRGSM